MRVRVPVVTLMLVAAVGCRPSVNTQEPHAPPGPPILLFGVDGMEWDVALPLIRQGKMPVLAGLMEKGASGRIKTLSPTLSPIIWTSIATGKTAAKHGIRAFAYESPDDPGNLRLFSSTDRKTKAFWNILSDRGRTVGTVGWWMTFPVEPINGIMVAQTNTLGASDRSGAGSIMKGSLVRGVEGQVWPPERQTEMLEVLAQCEKELPELTRNIFGQFKHPQTPLTRRLWENCTWAFRADATYSRIAEKIIRSKDRPELLAVYVGGPDVVGHRFWRYMVPDAYVHRPTDEEIEDYGHIIGDYYVYADRCLGRLIDAYDEELTVIVVSDHGMIPINTNLTFEPDGSSKKVLSGGHPREVEPPGVIVLAGPRIRPILLRKPLNDLDKSDLPFLCSVLDMTPTLLTLMGLPIGRDMDGLPAEHLIEPAWLAEHPGRTLPTYDTPDWLAKKSGTELRSPDETERRKQLGALGYIDDDTEEDEEDKDDTSEQDVE